MLDRNRTSSPTTPKKVSRRNKIILSIAALLIAIYLVCGIAVYLFAQSLRDDPAEVAAAEQSLEIALGDLLLSPATHFKGSARGSDRALRTIEADITSNGSILGAVSVGDSNIEVLVSEAQTFIRADTAFWRQRGINEVDLPRYSTQWVKVSPDILGIDLHGFLDPILLAEQLEPELLVDSDESGEPPTLELGEKISLNGTSVQALHIQDTTIYLTQAEPKRIVRIRSRRPQANRLTIGQVALAARSPDPGEFEFDLTGLTNAEVDKLVNRFNQRYQELLNSIDTQVRFSLDGTITFNPCNFNFCVATLWMQNTVASDSPYLVANKVFPVAVTIEMTLDGRALASCTDSREVQPNTRTQFSCRASYSIPKQQQAMPHQFRARAVARAQPVVKVDIDRIIKDLRQEVEQKRLARNNTNQPSFVTFERLPSDSVVPHPGFKYQRFVTGKNYGEIWRLSDGRLVKIDGVNNGYVVEPKWTRANDKEYPNSVYHPKHYRYKKKEAILVDQLSRQMQFAQEWRLKGVRVAVSNKAAQAQFERILKQHFPEQFDKRFIQVMLVPGDGM